MTRSITLTISIFFVIAGTIQAQTKKDAIDMKQVALDYIDSGNH